MVLNGTVTADAHTTDPGDATASVRVFSGTNHGSEGDATINGDLLANAESDVGTSYALVEVDTWGTITWGPDADATATADSAEVLGVRDTQEDVDGADKAETIINEQDSLLDVTGFPDSGGAHMGNPVTGNVLGNDVHAGGDDIDVAGYTDPANGTLALDLETGEFTYTPDDPGFVGIDTFTYTATDGTGTTDPVLVTITMTNTLPVLINDVATTNEGVPVAGNVLVNDVDADGDSLTAGLVDGPTNASSFTLNPDGSFSYTPANGFIGEDSFTYSASDPEAGATPGQATVTITVNEQLTTAPPAAPGVDVRVEPEISGIPALVKWVAEELGVNERLIDVRFANTPASARDIPPYDAYSSFKKAANVLRDRRGIYTDALAQVINEFASSAAPPTEEQMASIAEAISRSTETGNVYALAGLYLDSLAEYVAFLVHEVSFSEEDAVEFAATKYVDQLAEKENVGLAAYLTARLANLYDDSID